MVTPGSSSKYSNIMNLQDLLPLPTKKLCKKIRQTEYDILHKGQHRVFFLLTQSTVCRVKVTYGATEAHHVLDILVVMWGENRGCTP